MRRGECGKGDRHLFLSDILCKALIFFFPCYVADSKRSFWRKLEEAVSDHWNSLIKRFQLPVFLVSLATRVIRVI